MARNSIVGVDMKELEELSRFINLLFFLIGNRGECLRHRSLPHDKCIDILFHKVEGGRTREGYEMWSFTIADSLPGPVWKGIPLKDQYECGYLARYGQDANQMTFYSPALFRSIPKSLLLSGGLEAVTAPPLSYVAFPAGASGPSVISYTARQLVGMLNSCSGSTYEIEFLPSTFLTLVGMYNNGWTSGIRILSFAD